MAVYSNTEELHRVMVDLWTAIKNDPAMAKPLLDSRLTVQFHYREPEGRLTVDCSDGQEMKFRQASVLKSLTSRCL